MPHKWKDRQRTYDEKNPPAPVKEVAKSKDPMPSVSPDFMEWLRKILIVDVTGTNMANMQPNDALKQVSFANGVLWLKAKIHEGNQQNESRKLDMTIVAPDSRKE